MLISISAVELLLKRIGNKKVIAVNAYSPQKSRCLSRSIIVKKLSSHKRHGRLKKALWEYNKILSSIHLLNLIDNHQLRRDLKKARNRTESYHQLQQSIRKIHDGKFRGTSTIENEIWNQSTRLLANFIIAYNGIILSEFRKLNKDKEKDIDNISPIAWQHINLAGRYSFKAKRKKPNIENIIQLLMKTTS